MQIVTFDSMCKYYPGLHTIDEEQAIDLICEDFNLKIDIDSLNEDKKLETMAMTGTIHEYNEKLRKQLVDMDLFEDIELS